MILSSNTFIHLIANILHISYHLFGCSRPCLFVWYPLTSFVTNVQKMNFTLPSKVHLLVYRSKFGMSEMLSGLLWSWWLILHLGSGILAFSDYSTIHYGCHFPILCTVYVQLLYPMGWENKYMDMCWVHDFSCRLSSTSMLDLIWPVISQSYCVLIMFFGTKHTTHSCKHCTYYISKFYKLEFNFSKWEGSHWVPCS